MYFRKRGVSENSKNRKFYIKSKLKVEALRVHVN